MMTLGFKGLIRLYILAFEFCLIRILEGLVSWRANQMVSGLQGTTVCVVLAYK